MANPELGAQLHTLTSALVEELISLTPETMAEIQFELVATADGGADVGLLENHPDATRVALSDRVYACARQYLPLVKQYVPDWRRTLIVVRETEAGWNVAVDFERG